MVLKHLSLPGFGAYSMRGMYGEVATALVQEVSLPGLQVHDEEFQQGFSVWPFFLEVLESIYEFLKQYANLDMMVTYHHVIPQGLGTGRQHIPSLMHPTIVCCPP